MGKIPFYQYLSISLTIFVMIFDAGNLIYPLAIGYSVGSLVIWAFIGFFITSIMMPFLGFFATSLYRGNYQSFLESYVGVYAANFITLCSMLLLGPTGCIPRCVSFAHSSFYALLPIPRLLFGLIFMLICYFLASERSNLISVLGRIIAPIILACCFILIAIGFMTESTAMLPSSGVFQSIGIGLYNGLFTFDLLAMIFCSRVIYYLVERVFLLYEVDFSSSDIISFLAISGLLAGFYSVAIYGGMIYIAAFHAKSLGAGIAYTDLFSSITRYLFGFKLLGFVQATIVVLACFSSSLTSLVVFSDYVTLINTRISYSKVVLYTTLISLVLGFLELHHIHMVMEPLIMVTYPFLITCVVFVICNLLLKKIKGKKVQTSY